MTLGETLPKPVLDARPLGAHRIPALTDDALFCACGVRIAFTGRAGGISEGAYSSLNLGTHVNDERERVMENRRRLLDALGAPEAPLVVPNQVHGTNVVEVGATDERTLACVRAQADAGADALVVSVPGAAALLNFADCLPVIIVSPTGRFSIAHAGWRGALAGIAGKAVHALARADTAPPSAYNVYLGPHIRSECFEVSTEIARRFAERFGAEAVVGQRNVSLANVVSKDVAWAGVLPERICDARICTKCNSSMYYSYRATDGACGRHGAAAFWKEG